MRTQNGVNTVLRMLSVFFLLVLSTTVFAAEPYEGLWTGTTNRGEDVELFAKGNNISLTVKYPPTLCYGTFTWSGTASSVSRKITVEYKNWTLEDLVVTDEEGKGGNSLLGFFESSSDTWSGDYTAVGCVSGTISWEAFRTTSISHSPKEFETVDVIASFDSPYPSSTFIKANDYFYFAAGDKVHQISSSDMAVVNSFSLPVTAFTGPVFDGSHLWFVGEEGVFKGKFYKTNLSGQIVSSYDFTDSFLPDHLAFGGGYLWGINGFKLYRFDSASNRMDSFGSGLFPSEGIVFDGTHLWSTTYFPSKLVKLTTSGSVVASYELPAYDIPKGIVFDSSYVWVSHGMKLSKFDTSGILIASYDVPDAGKLVFDGVDLWLNGSSKLYRLRDDVATLVPGDSRTHTFTIINNGSDTLSTRNFSITGADQADFTLKNNTCTGNSLKTFETCTLDIEFKPTTPGLKKATLEIASNDPQTPTLSIPLSGGKADVSKPGNTTATSPTGETKPSAGHFNGGIAINGGTRQPTATLNLADPVKVSGDMTIDPAHVGQTADLFVYAETTIPGNPDTLYFMLKGEPTLEILAWDQRLANLVAFQSNVTLASEQHLSMYQGHFIYAGTLKVYWGYRLTDGTVVTNSQPIDITIN